MIQVLPTKLAQLVRLYRMINRHHKHFLKNIVVIIDTVLNFIRSHPLMDSAVAHQDDKPVFYKRDLLFTHLVVDKLKYDVFGDQMEYTVFYAGTSKSPLLYIYVSSTVTLVVLYLLILDMCIYFRVLYWGQFTVVRFSCKAFFKSELYLLNLIFTESFFTVKISFVNCIYCIWTKGGLVNKPFTSLP